MKSGDTKSVEDKKNKNISILEYISVSTQIRLNKAIVSLAV